MDCQISENFVEDGNQMIVRFENNFGASIVNHSGSYGLELAVIKFDSESMDDFHLVYDTPVSNDVIGWIQDMDELNSYLIQIAQLNS